MQPAKRRLQSQLTSNERELIEDIAGFYDDPLGFVHYAFPWGEPGTPLADEPGPDRWQVGFLTTVGEEVRKRESPTLADVQAAIQIAVASGHGVGKSAEVAWAVLWFMSTREHPQVVVTANTQTQLTTKTWRELAKWHKLAINGHWFEWTATRLYHKLHPETWFAAAIPWSEHNSEAFAGTHEKHVLLIFDEASKIADKIWEVAEGAMTTPGAMWFAFGNPTQNTGRFRECFGKFKHRWHTRQIDSRTCRKANRAQLDAWVHDYGEDSDFVRVRVRGVFPRAGFKQFIPSNYVAAAQARTIEGWERSPKILAVDVARHGEDESVITIRQGAKLHPQIRLRIPDLMQLSARIAWEINECKPAAIFIDASGMGWGVVDRLRQLNYDVIGVQTGEKADEDDKFFNKRVELWDRMKHWLGDTGDIPADDPMLQADLEGPEYLFDTRKDLLRLERKEDMKARGLSSPDGADSLALTFAQPVFYEGQARHPGVDRPVNWRAL